MYAMKPSVRIDLGRLDEGIAGRIVRCVDGLCRDYPVVGERLHAISTIYGVSSREPEGSGEWQDSTLAACNTVVADISPLLKRLPAVEKYLGTSGYAIKPFFCEFSISFNPHHFGSEESLQNVIKLMKETRNYPAGACRIEGTVAHEFGHAIHNWIRRDFPEVNDTIYDLVQQGIENDEPICSALSASGLFQATMDAALSGQKASDTVCAEAFANAFSAVRYGTPTARSLPLVMYVRDTVRERLG